MKYDANGATIMHNPVATVNEVMLTVTASSSFLKIVIAKPRRAAPIRNSATRAMSTTRAQHRLTIPPCR